MRPGELQARLETAVAKHKVPGASVALFKDGVIETAAAGVVNVTTGVTVTPETVMHIGSITKTINTTLVMQLVDEGKILLDRPLKSYLPEFKLADSGATERITVRMLLNHTSGINGELTPEAGHDQERVVDALGRIATMDQLHEPGAELSYCNPAMVLAGYLVQRLTGRSWYDLVKERIFRPLGMDHAVVLPEEALLHRASVGHFLTSDGTPARTSFAFLPLSYSPAGATAMMSATDLVTFARAHLGDGGGANGARLLSAASVEAMRTRSASYKGVGFADFGLGWMLMRDGIVGHGGGGPGVFSWLYTHVPSKTAIAVLTNAAHGTALANEIATPAFEPFGVKLPGVFVAELVAQATDAPVDPAPYVGTYENVATVLRVVPRGNGLAITSRTKFRIYDTSNLTESAPVPIRPTKENAFVLGGALIALVNPDRSGRMSNLATNGRLLKRTG
jgi:CubicO group peptidase (beta-lactamase class C family)